MTNALILLSLLIWPLGHLLDIRASFIPIALPLLDILVALLFLTNIPTFIRNIKQIKEDRSCKFLLVFLSVATLSLALRLGDLSLPVLNQPSLYLARLILYFSLYYVLKFNQNHKIIEYAKIAITLFVSMGVIQYIVSPDMSFLKYIGYDDHYYRLVGTFFDPNYTGAIFSATAIYLLSLEYLILSLPIFVALGLTFSRASYVSFVVPAVTWGVMKKKYHYIIVCLILLAVVIICSPKPFGEGVNLARTFSIYSRLGSWQQGIELFMSRPFLGQGYNTLTISGNRIGIDNSFIFLLATTGIVGFISFALFLVSSTKHKSLPLKLAIFSLVIHSLFNNTLFYPPIVCFYLFLLTRD